MPNSCLGILNGNKTTLGRSLLRTWLLRPCLSIPVIKSRHDAVGCFMRSENIATATQLHNHLKGIKNIPRIMNLLRGGKGRVSEWQGLVKVRVPLIRIWIQILSAGQFTFHATMLRDSLSELYQASQVELMSKVCYSYSFFLCSILTLLELIGVLDITRFKEIGVKVNNIVCTWCQFLLLWPWTLSLQIDWEESSHNDRVCVRPLIDEDLDNRKHVYHGIDSVLVLLEAFHFARASVLMEELVQCCGTNIINRAAKLRYVSQRGLFSTTRLPYMCANVERMARWGWDSRSWWVDVPSGLTRFSFSVSEWHLSLNSVFIRVWPIQDIRN